MSHHKILFIPPVGAILEEHDNVSEISAKERAKSWAASLKNSGRSGRVEVLNSLGQWVDVTTV